MPFNKLNHSHLGELRPRFRLKTDLEPEQVLETLVELLRTDHTAKGEIIDSYAILSIPKIEQHYWSPELQIRIEPGEFEHEGSTVIRCLVGPKQSVWLLFIFVYTFIGVISLIGGIFGLAQWQLGKPSIFTWFLPAGLLLLPTIWLTATIGQKAGRDQMLHLISFLYHSLDNKSKVTRI